MSKALISIEVLICISFNFLYKSNHVLSSTPK